MRLLNRYVVHSGLFVCLSIYLIRTNELSLFLKPRSLFFSEASFVRFIYCLEFQGIFCDISFQKM